MHPAVILDRDETLIRADSLPDAPPPPANRGDVTDPSQVELLPSAREACHRLKRAGLRLIVTSNQGGVARGAINLRTVEAINARVNSLIGDGIIDAFYVCPFHPNGYEPPWKREHPWRKPAPGMILAAASELAIDLPNSWAIGDRQRDIDSAIAAGIPADRCFLLAPGTPQSRTPDVGAAADIILFHLGLQSPASSSMPLATSTTPTATVRLRALDGNPLADPRTRATVIATASAIAERTGISLAAISADDASITVTLNTDRLAGLGFLAELRRATNTWFLARHPGQSLWGEPPDSMP